MNGQRSEATRNAVPSRQVVLRYATIAAVFGIAGLLARLWIFSRLPLNGDSAVVGLMGESVLHGHLVAFYWGQHYGGGIEPYLAAAVFALFGQGNATLSVVPILLDVASAVLVWRIGLRVLRPAGALAAACMFWIWPPVFMSFSTIDIGFYWSCLMFGLVVVLCALRIANRPERLFDWGLMGLATGLGWWSTPEIAYFALPAGAWLLAVFAIRWFSSWQGNKPNTDIVASSSVIDPSRDSTSRGRDPVTSLANNTASVATTQSSPPASSIPWSMQRKYLLIGGSVTAVAAIAGALPWLWANLPNGFKSLVVNTQPAVNFTYQAHLHLFFADALPLALGLRAVPSDRWITGSSLGSILYATIGIVSAAALVRLARSPAGRLIAFALAAYPFFYAISPYAWYWQDDRYALFLLPFAALTVGAVAQTATGIAKPAANASNAQQQSGKYQFVAVLNGPVLNRMCQTLSMLVACTLLVLSVMGVAAILHTPSGSNRTAWVALSDSSLRGLDSTLNHRSIHTAWASYWVAEPLTLVSHERLMASPVTAVRWWRPYADASCTANTAWIFVTGNGSAGTGLDPGSISPATFEAALTRRQISYTAFTTRPYLIVLPGSIITPDELGRRPFSFLAPAGRPASCASARTQHQRSNG
ncbi:MAG: glycosyltransferase family 39 protein [Acidimicrobiales bacterium]